MSARRRERRDVGPDAIPAFFRLVGAFLLAGFAVGLARALQEITAQGYVTDELSRIAILSATERLSQSIGWALRAGLVVGVPSLAYAFFLQKSFAAAAVPVSLFPVHNLVLRLTGAEPEGLTRLFGPLPSLFTPDVGYITAVLVVSLLAVALLRGPLRALSGSRRVSAVRLAVGGLVALMLPIVVHGIAERIARHRGPNVLLITVDTLRADHLGTYGYPRPTSPQIDAFARRGAVFESALTPTPRTTQSIASIMTSLYPQTHGVRSLWGKLPRRLVTLAELFRDAGYLTAGFWTTTFLDETRGLAQGFTDYENTAAVSDRANHVTDRAILWLAENVGPRPEPGKTEKRRPFFLWLHYRDPHMPYSPPPEDRVFVDASYQGEYREGVRFFPTKELMVYNHLGLIDSTDIAQAVALYDGEIRYVDRQIGRVLKDLETRGLTENTAVVITSDHGEALSEHGYYFDHGDLLHDPGLHVPLIVVGPDVAAGRVREQVSLLDIAPTVASMAKLPWRGGEGRDLGAALRRAPDDASEAVLAATPFFTESGENLLGPFNPFRFRPGIAGKLRALRTERWKLVLTPMSKGAPRLALYDMTADPGELVNVIETESAVARDLDQKLEAFLNSAPGAEDTDLEELDEQTRAKLRAMGYLR